MSRHEGRALVLDVMDYRESSSLVRLLTENEGRISVIARGLRKPRSGSGSAMAAVQPFNLIHVQYLLKEAQTLGTMTGTELERAWSGPREDLVTYALASYWFEILKESSQPRDVASAVFQQTVEFMDYQEIHPGLDLETIVLLSDLCGSLGFGLHWGSCSVCGRPGDSPVQFSIKSGPLCGECVGEGREGVPLKEGERMLVRQMLQARNLPAQGLKHEDMIGLLGLMNRFLVYHLERPLRTFGFLQSTL